MTTFFTSGAAFSSIDDTWTTPPDFFTKMDAIHGFTLDAAALNSSTLVADNYYAPDHPIADRRDALVRDWVADARGGAIWLNPPYGRQIGRWMHYAVHMAKKGGKVVCLVPARTDTAWFHDTAFAHGQIQFLRGRLKFGNGLNSAPFPSAVVVFDGSIVDTDTPIR